MSAPLRDLADGLTLVETPEHTGGLISSSSGAIVVDPPPPGPALDALGAHACGLGVPVKLVVSTGRVAARAPGAGAFRGAMLLVPSLEDVDTAPLPCVAFTRDAYLRLGGASAELLRLGAADAGRLLVHVPSAGALFAGAVLPGGEAALKDVLARVEGPRPRRVIPGRGPARPVGGPRPTERETAGLTLVRPEGPVRAPAVAGR